MAYSNRGSAWEKKGEYDKAIADYNQGHAAQSQFRRRLPQSRLRLGDRKASTTRPSPTSTEAMRLNPNFAAAYYNRGNAWRDKGDYDKAIADFNQALAVNPKYADAYNALAWLQAACPDEKYRDGKKAFANASKAYELEGGKGWNSLDKLAVAYAESGDFDAAQEWAGKALKLAPTEEPGGPSALSWTFSSKASHAVCRFRAACDGRRESRRVAAETQCGH